MANGLDGRNGQPVAKAALAARNREHELAAGLTLVMEVKHVLAIALKKKCAR